MIDGRPLVDVHLHAARLPTLKTAWQEWAHDFGGMSTMERVYGGDDTVDADKFDEYLVAEGVDKALLLAEYSPKVTGIQPIEDVLPLVEHNPARFRPVANINPHLHYPVKAELVASLIRPGGNLTGITNLGVEVGPKRLELLRELLPTATAIAVLVNPANPALAEAYLQDLRPVARNLGVQLHVLNASSDRDFETVFASLARLRASALLIMPDVLFTTRAEQLAALSLRYAVPAIYQYRPFTAAGGLVSYGPDEVEYYRLVGIYTGKILQGEKPGNLPVVQSTKVELILNLKTAKSLGLNVPQPLVGRADEVIE